MNKRDGFSLHHLGKRRLLNLCVVLTLTSFSATAAAVDDAQSSSDAPDTQTLEGVVVSAPNYVPRDTNGAAKSTIPLIETPQSVTVIPRDQIDLAVYVITVLKLVARYNLDPPRRSH